MTHTARTVGILFFFQFALRHRNPVPVTVLLAELVLIAVVSIVLEYFRWNYRELQFFVFNQAQARSTGASHP